MMKRRDLGTQLAAAGLAAGMSHTDTSRDNPPFTNVFAQPAAYDKFMKTGTWPDKTILIAEMRESATEVSINKSGRVQTANVLAVEAEVKDTAKGGWVFFGFENGARTGKTVSEVSCLLQLPRRTCGHR